MSHWHASVPSTSVHVWLFPLHVASGQTSRQWKLPSVLSHWVVSERNSQPFWPSSAHSFASATTMYPIKPLTASKYEWLPTSSYRISKLPV